MTSAAIRRELRELKWVWVAAEVLLAATTLTAIVMLTRVFDDTSFVAPLAFTTIVAHAVLITIRRVGFGLAVAAAASLAAVGVAIVATHYATTAVAVVFPTASTVDQVAADLRGAADVFNSQQTPVPAVTGFLVVASLAFWLLAFVADWAAFRLMSPGQALVPVGTVVVFVSLLGVPENRIGYTALLVIVGITFVLAHRASSRAVDGIWLDRGPVRGYFSTLGAGAVVAVIAAGIGIAGGPAVPGADDEPLIELGGEGRRETRPIEVISPLVQIQPRLVDQSDTIVFLVETTERAYWRIAALDVFDGSLWRSQGQFRGTDDRLSVAYSAQAPTRRLVSTFDLRDLNAVWAPAAYLPVELDNLSPVELNYEAESATFIVDTSTQRVSDGLVYRVESSIAELTPALLRHLPTVSDETIDPRYLSLPVDYSPMARSLAAEITAGLSDPYDQALALQNYFRDNFTYDIDVAKGHDIARLEDFLAVQRGYCEQFAGTFASMARAIGLPARVATGFTPGDPDPTTRDRYIVRGRHAHAWPEVFIAGAGWVAFEPTPGRGAPGATDYTGVPEAQETPLDPLTEQESSDLAPSALGAAPTPTPDLSAFDPDPFELEPDVEVEAPVDTSTPSRAPWILALLAAAFGLWAWGVPALKRLKAARRRDRAGDDHRRVITLAWAQVVDRLESDGYPPTIDETVDEYSERMSFDMPASFPGFGELSTLAVAAAYSPDDPDPTDADRAFELAAGINRALEMQLPWVVRHAHGLDPRPLLSFRDPIDERATRLASGASDQPADR